MSADQRLADLGLTLPSPPKPIGNYVPFRLAGNLLFLSGVGPRRADETMITGKVGADLTVEQGYEAAKLCGLNLLVNMIAAVATLARADTVLKVLGMVNALPDFGQQPEVINGCTDLFVQVLGEGGRPARSAVGMGGLPRGIAVEVEAVVLVRGSLTGSLRVCAQYHGFPGAKRAQRSADNFRYVERCFPSGDCLGASRAVYRSPGGERKLRTRVSTVGLPSRPS